MLLFPPSPSPPSPPPPSPPPLLSLSLEGGAFGSGCPGPPAGAGTGTGACCSCCCSGGASPISPVASLLTFPLGAEPDAAAAHVTPAPAGLDAGLRGAGGIGANACCCCGWLGRAEGGTGTRGVPSSGERSSLSLPVPLPADDARVDWGLGGGGRALFVPALAPGVPVADVAAAAAARVLRVFGAAPGSDAVGPPPRILRTVVDPSPFCAYLLLSPSLVAVPTGREPAPDDAGMSCAPFSTHCRFAVSPARRSGCSGPFSAAMSI